MSPIAIILILFVAVALLAPMIPMRRRKQKGFAGFPVVTASLIFINVLVFADTVTGDGDLNRYVALHFGMIPRSPNLLTLFTHIFLHGSFMHLFGNMLWLWLFGPHVEEALGRLEYLGFYLGGGIAAGLLHLVIADTLMPAAAVVPLVGASGAISAIMGIFAVRFWRAKVRVLLLFRIPAVVAVGLFGVWQIAEGFMLLADGGRSNHTANWAHIGGFVFGALLAVPLRMREDSQLEYGLEDAETAAKDGQLDQSASHYRTVLAATPDDAAAHHALARVLAQMRQGESAHRHYMEALRLFIRKSDLFNTARVYEDALLAFESFPLPPALLQRVASACENRASVPACGAGVVRIVPRTRRVAGSRGRSASFGENSSAKTQSAAKRAGDFLRICAFVSAVRMDKSRAQTANRGANRHRRLRPACRRPAAPEPLLNRRQSSTSGRPEVSAEPTPKPAPQKYRWQRASGRSGRLDYGGAAYGNRAENPR